MSNIFLVTPQTSEERIRKIDELSSGFIYAVSTSSTTGKDTDFAAQQSYFERLQQMKLRNPVLVGFGIKDHQTFNARTVADAYAAKVIPQNELSGNFLYQEIERLFSNNFKMSQMRQQMLSLAKPQAATDLAAQLLKLV